MIDTKNYKLFFYTVFFYILIFVRIVNSQTSNQLSTYNHLNINDPINKCDFCLCSMGISPLNFSGKGIRVDQRYLLIDKLINNNAKVDNNIGSYEKHLTFQISGIYSITQRFSFIGIIPFSIRSGREDINLITAHTSGIGDIILFARYFPIELHTINSSFLFSSQLGFKFPTGKSDEKDANNELIDPHLQLGTGSTDVLFGTNILYAYKKLGISNTLLLGLRNKGKTEYRFGNTFNYNLNAGYRIYQSGIGKNIVVLNAGFNGELRGRESQDGMTIYNSGGNTIYASAGINLFLTPRLEIESQFNLPVYYHLYGTQNAETYRISSGIQYILE